LPRLFAIASSPIGRPQVVQPALAIGLLVLAGLVWVGSARPVGAQTELVRMEPPANGLLAAPPGRLDLWFTEGLAPGVGSPTLRLIDDAGKEVLLRGTEVDPADPRHVGAAVVDAKAGSHTVVWAVRAADGHMLSGSYAFGVAGGRAPGAATVEGDAPRAWAVATRWLTFLGAALAAAGYAFARFVRGRSVLGNGSDEPSAATRRSVGAIAAGAAVGLLATLAEPVLATVAPPAGTLAPSLGEAFGGLPGGWWVRLTALGLSMVLALGLLSVADGLRMSGWRTRSPVPGPGGDEDPARSQITQIQPAMHAPPPRTSDQAETVARGGRSLPLPRAHDWVGLGLGLAALVGLSLTSNDASRESWGTLGLGSNVLHQWATALWVGGLAHLGLSWSAIRPTAGAPVVGTDPVRRFARLAVGLVVVGVGTGVVNAGVVLPSAGELADSAYGVAVLLKAAVLVPVLALATLHRSVLWSAGGAARRLGAAFLTRRTERAAAALVLLVALGGSVLAVSAPPGARALPATTLVDLAAPVGGEAAAGGTTVRLQVQPAQTGSNAILVRLTDAAGAPVLAPPPIRVDAVGLDHAGERLGIVPGVDSSGAYAIAGVGLNGAGWWRLEVVLSPPGQVEERVPFYLLLPDPNVHGEETAPAPAASTEATAVFERGLADLTALHRVRYSERLASGDGAVLPSDFAVSDGSDGRAPALAVNGSGRSLVQVGDRRWTRVAGGAWTEGPAGPPFVPADWRRTYEQGEGIRLGRVEEVDGEACQVVTFVVPAEGRGSPARYAWWVGIDSGHVRRMAMVAPGHYMVQTYRDFDARLVIAPPAEVGPSGTPEAGV